MVATDLQNPDNIIQETEAKIASNTNIQPASISVSKDTDSPDTDVVRLRVSIGGTFSQVRDSKRIHFYLNRHCALSPSLLCAVRGTDLGLFISLLCSAERAWRVEVRRW